MNVREKWRFMDERGWLGGRIHWLDALLILAVGLLVSRVFISAWPRIDRRTEVLVQMEIIIPGISADLAAGIGVGQWVREEKTHEYLGKITEKRVLSPEGNGRGFSEPTPATWEKKVDLIILLEREGRLNPREGIFLGKIPIRVGQVRDLITLYAQFQGKINRLSVGEK